MKNLGALPTIVASLILIPCCLAAEEQSHIVDLSHELFEGIPTFPGGASFRAEPIATIEQAGYFANRLELGEHTGTHVDAPIHFQPDALSVNALLPTQLVGPGVLLSIASKAAANPDATVSLADVMQWEQTNGPIPARSFVLIQTGWSTRWPDETAYRNADEKGIMHFPGLAEEAAVALLARDINGVGIDTLSIDPGTSTSFASHKLLAEANIIVIENLANLEQLPMRGFTVVVAPLKIRGGSGSPARVLAILEHDRDD